MVGRLAMSYRTAESNDWAPITNGNTASMILPVQANCLLTAESTQFHTPKVGLNVSKMTPNMVFAMLYDDRCNAAG
jgi:hypothetical protein